MNQSSELINGQLIPTSGTIEGRTRNINTYQDETTPLPYTTSSDGEWMDDSVNTPWTYGNSVWYLPNSLGVDGTTIIDWNIVNTSHNVISGEKDITVLGLISDTANKKITISNPNNAQNESNSGQSLEVTHYLKLDGIIDLIGESQLIQSENSILDVSSSGYLKRDQQGTTNFYNYNYWSSPVSLIDTGTNNDDYTIDNIFKDATDSNNPLDFNWTNNYDANGSTTPKTMSIPCKER